MQVLHLYQCILNINYKLSPVFKLVCMTVTFLSLLNDHCPWWSTSPRFFPLARVLNLSVPGGLAGIATKCYWIGETMMVHTRIQTWDPMDLCQVLYQWCYQYEPVWPLQLKWYFNKWDCACYQFPFSFTVEHLSLISPNSLSCDHIVQSTIAIQNTQKPLSNQICYS